MAYLNQQQRESLRHELLGMKYNSAKGKLNGMDPKGKLVYWRNAQRVGEYHTRFDLLSLGTTVTIVEGNETSKPGNFEGVTRKSMDVIDVRVEPLPDNQT